MTNPFDAFFQKAKPPLGCVAYEAHPSRHMLLDYVYEQLEDEDTVFRVSAHVATCQSCFEKVSALREELAEMQSGLAVAIEITANPAPVKRSFTPVLREFFGKVLNHAVWTNRKLCYVHIGTYAVAGLLLLLTLGIAHVLSPRILLASSANASENIWPRVFQLALLGAFAWGIWGLTGLAYHTFCAFRQKDEKRIK